MDLTVHDEHEDKLLNTRMTSTNAHRLHLQTHPRLVGRQRVWANVNGILGDLAQLIDQAHRVGVSEGGAVGGAMRWFYKRLHTLKLYGQGVRYLRMRNEDAA